MGLRLYLCIYKWCSTRKAGIYLFCYTDYGLSKNWIKGLQPACIRDRFNSIPPLFSSVAFLGKSTTQMGEITEDILNRNFGCLLEETRIRLVYIGTDTQNNNAVSCLRNTVLF